MKIRTVSCVLRMWGLTKKRSNLGLDYKKILRVMSWIDVNKSPNIIPSAIEHELRLASGELEMICHRWGGVDVEKFLKSLELEHVKMQFLKSLAYCNKSKESSLGQTLFASNLSIKFEIAVPGGFGYKGQGLNIFYAWRENLFGDYLIAVTDQGVCGLAFELDDGRASTEKNLFSSWKRAAISESHAKTEPYAIDHLDPRHKTEVLAIGTQFQIKIWKALLKVPLAAVVSYQKLSSIAGESRGARAVGGALAKNQISWLIPCHRVVSSSGDISGYRWGLNRKRAMLSWEGLNECTIN